MEITKHEESLIEVVRANQSMKIIGVRKQWEVGRKRVTFSWRSKQNPMGRFGGGWNWKLGVQVGGRTVIFSLLVCEIDIRPAS